MRFRARSGSDVEKFAAMDLEAHLGDRALKTKYVSTMFDVLAPGYDTFTRLFSFGMDRKWKARLVEEGARRAVHAPRILDLACGTGDLARQLSASSGAAFALGLDFSAQMLVEAKTRANGHGPALRLAACDMLDLCVASASVDAVSIGYGLRNTADPDRALREIARVLRPGGILLNLDFYRPEGALWREIFLGYMWHAGRIAGWLWHRAPMVYGYLSPSIRRYVTMREFERQLETAGFRVEWRGSHLGGAIGLHAARLR